MTVSGTLGADQLNVNQVRIDNSTISCTGTAGSNEDLLLTTSETDGEIRIGVGDGTNQPRNLRVYGNIIAKGTGNDFDQLDVDNITLDDDTISTKNDHNLRLQADGSRRVIIGSSNVLQVNNNLEVSGTSTFSSALDINSTINVSGNATFDDLKIDGNAAGGGSGNQGVKIENITPDTQGARHHIRLLPKDNGDVYIGSSDTNALIAEGDVVAFNSSDRTLKKNIKPIPNAVDKVLSLSGNTFEWMEEAKFKGLEDIGVIAQEVEALGLPGLVTTRPSSGKKAVRYEKLIPILIEAIKELKAEIEELKK